MAGQGVGQHPFIAFWQAIAARPHDYEEVQSLGKHCQAHDYHADVQVTRWGYYYESDTEDERTHPIRVTVRWQAHQILLRGEPGDDPVALLARAVAAMDVVRTGAPL